LALKEWRAWCSAGLVSLAEGLADRASDELTGVGAVPTSARAYLPPRLRAFTLPGVSRADLDAQCAAASVRAWTGVDPAGATLLRLALHVYNDEADVETAVQLVRRLISAAASKPGASV
jgi:isopenicillin-N epimerase